MLILKLSGYQSKPLLPVCWLHSQSTSDPSRGSRKSRLQTLGAGVGAGVGGAGVGAGVGIGGAVVVVTMRGQIVGWRAVGPAR